MAGIAKPEFRAHSPVIASGPRKRRKRRSRWPLVVTLLVILAAGGGWGFYHYEVAAKPKTKPSEIVAVTKGTIEKSVESYGKVVSNLDVDIKCRANGEVVKLPFDISESVKKGDLVCQLDPTDEQLAVRSAQAQVTQSTAKLAQAKEDLQEAEENLQTTRDKDEATLASAKVKAANLRAKADRQQELAKQNLGSREELESAQTDAADAELARTSAQIAIEELKQQAIQVEYKRETVKTAQAQLESDQVALDAQRQQLAYTTVTAPLDGVVSALNVQQGTIVASGTNGFSGGTTIMTLSDLSHIYVTATVDESDIGNVQVGQPARIVVASFPNRTFTGQVVRIATKGVNTSNVVTFEVKIEVLDKHKNLLRPEMTGNVTIVEDQKQNVLTVPSAAVTREGDKTFVTTTDGTRKQVTLGLEGEENVEVVSGLGAGDRVVETTAELPTRWKNDN